MVTAPLAIRRTAEISLSATKSAPRGPCASPLGCANAAVARSPSTRASRPDPASTAATVIGPDSSIPHSWWLPAMATIVAPPGSTATSHGDRRSVRRASPAVTPPRPRCPVPATVATAPVARSTRRTAWLPVSATSRDGVAVVVSIASPCGWRRRATRGAPSTSPGAPAPMRRRSVPSAAQTTSWWWPVSATTKASSCPPDPAMTTIPPGWARAPSTGASGRSGSGSRTSRSGCSARISRSSATSGPRSGSPEAVPRIVPSGRTTTSVGHDRTPYASHTAWPVSTTTGCVTPWRRTASRTSAPSPSVGNFGECTPTTTTGSSASSCSTAASTGSAWRQLIQA